MSVLLHEDFPHTWSATILAAPPLIAPARQFTYPMHVPGEEDAMQRGALLIEVRPCSGGLFLATAALGFRDPGMPSMLQTCPRADDLLIVSGGYAYLIDTLSPESCLHIALRPVVTIFPALSEGMLFLAGFRSVIALDKDGVCWESGPLSWEGVQLERVENGKLHGSGWDMKSDRDIPFAIDIRTGTHEGGGFNP